jgi:hypothetical protein
MKLKFIGGPWDGVEFEAAVAPDYLRLQSLVEEQILAEEPAIPEMDESDDADTEDPVRAAAAGIPGETPKQAYIAYEREKDAGDVPVILYKFSPGALPWWESELGLD